MQGVGAPSLVEELDSIGLMVNNPQHRNDIVTNSKDLKHGPHLKLKKKALNKKNHIRTNEIKFP